MTLEEARAEFSVRCYRWAMEEARQEWESGFQRLRALPSSAALRAVSYFDSLAREDQWQLFGVLLRKFHPDAAQRLGESLTARDEGLFQRALAARMQPVPEESEAREKPMKKRSLAAASRQHLRAVFGGPHEKLPGGVDLYETDLADWKVTTLIDLGGRLPSYFHNIETRSGDRLVHLTSLLARLGISSQTAFDLVKEGEEEAAAKLWAALSEDFLKASRILLDGLSND
jgi:hypothetical protein